jgi:tripartite-type tricarboxylate transporter receptor subunit TctC
MQAIERGRATRRQWLALAGAAAAAGTGNTWAQAASSRLARFYVGFPPGGSTDVVARLVATQLKGYADTVIVENLPGAAGRLAVSRVKGSAPDGNSVLVSPAAMMSLYPHVYTRLAYEPLTDFVPVTAVGTVAFCLAVSNAAVPAQVRTLNDLGEWLKANPKERSYASGGAGTPMHFLGVMVAKHLNQDLTHVAYKGAAPMIQDLLGGQVAFGFTVLGDSLPHIESGKLRAIAVSSPQRSPYLPQVPTFGESGAPQIQAQENFGLYLPAGAPAERVQRLAASVRDAMNSPELKAGLAKLACAPTAMSSAEFRQFLEADLNRWRPVVKASGFSLDE